MVTNTRPQLPTPDPTTFEGNFAEPFFKNAYQEAFRQFNQGGPQFFGGPTVAGFSPQQLESQRQLQGLAPGFQRQGSLQQGALANQLGQDVRQFQLPGQINAPGQVGQVGVQGISPELQRAVTNPILQQLQDQTLPGISSGATQAGAFGGSRQGILENQARSGATGAMTDALARATLQQRGQDINQRGQDIQQGQFGSDFLSNQRQQDIGSQLQQRGQNFGALSAGQGAAAGVRQGMLAGPGLLGGVGAQQQQMNQRLIDASRQRFDFGQNSQQQQLAKLFGFLGGRPDFANDGTTPASGTSSAIADATDAYNLYNMITG